MGSTRGTLQWTLVVFNTLSVIISILIISAVAYEFDKFSVGSPQHTEQIVELCAACVLLISAFVGCCAAAHNSIPTLIGFIFIFVLLLLTHAWKLFRYNEEKLINATESLVAYKWLEELDKPGAMHAIEQKYECCGKDSHTDYTSVGMSVPLNCYNLPEPDVESTLFGDGCVEAMKRSHLQIYRFEWFVHWVMIGYESCGILLASLLIWRIHSKQRRYHYY